MLFSKLEHPSDIGTNLGLCVSLLTVGLPESAHRRAGPFATYRQDPDPLNDVGEPRLREEVKSRRSSRQYIARFLLARRSACEPRFNRVSASRAVEICSLFLKRAISRFHQVRDLLAA